MGIKLTGRILGVVAGVASIVLYVIFDFFNPYSSIKLEPNYIPFTVFCLPACLAIFAALTDRKLFMIIAFLWTFPFSAYAFFTPGIFSLFGATCLLYFISFLFLFFAEKRSNLKTFR